MSENLHENCGIAAVYIKENGNGEAANKALFYLYKLLLNLQNRGQLSAGVTTYNPHREQLLDTHRDLGPVNEVFKTSDREQSLKIFKRYAGTKGIGHVRYATSGSEERGYAQPFERHHGKLWKWFSFCFNGNLANYTVLKKNLEKLGYYMTHQADTEVIMHYLSKEFAPKKKPDLVKVFSNLARIFDGMYNIAFINADGDIIVARDPYGFRPLVYGFNDSIFMAASESNALINCGITDYKPLEPGHLIWVRNGSIKVHKFAESKGTAHCMFEWVYFSNVSSVNDGKPVYVSRTKLGKELAKLETEKATNEHIVVPVPDTAKAAGDAFAYELGIPSREGLIRNRYVGRTFIEGSSRDDRVQNKYTVIKEVVEGKKVFLVDDSIVRGSTTGQIVRYLKKVGGVKEVHVRVTCPPIRGPCFYGIDMSTVSALFVPKFEKNPNSGEISKETCDKIAKEMGADSLIYQTVGGLVRSIGFPKSQLCTACITGEYPTLWGKKLIKVAWDNYKKGIKERTYSC